MAGRYVLDTNMITALLRGEPGVTAAMTEAVGAGAELFLCPVVFYEILRGLLHRDARNQLQLFLRYAALLAWDDFSQDDWQEAARLWAELRSQGLQTGDADLLIGVYALRRLAVVVTANEKDFAPLGVPAENWLAV